MKALVYIHSYYPYEDSNTNFITPLIEQLVLENEVYIVTYNVSSQFKHRDNQNNIEIYRYKNFSGFVSKLLYFNDMTVDFSEYNILKKMLAHCLRKISNFVLPHVRYSDINLIKSIIKEKDIDVVISVTSPIRPQYVTFQVMKSNQHKRNNISWFAYFMDPYATYVGNADRREFLIKQEAKIYNECDRVILTKEMYNDNHLNQLNRFSEKCYPINLANIRRIKRSENSLLDYKSNCVNCLYAGSLQDISVRNPEFFFKIISNSHNIHFHLLITTWCEETLKLKDMYLSNSTNVTFYERMDIENTLSCMSKADILINLGNLCTNQVPGKVHDYISLGKPIVNFHVLNNDTSKELLTNYPIKINIEESLHTFSDLLRTFKIFCHESKESFIEFEIIENLYYDYLSQNQAKRVLEFIEDVIKFKND